MFESCFFRAGLFYTSKRGLLINLYISKYTIASYA